MSLRSWFVVIIIAFVATVGASFLFSHFCWFKRNEHVALWLEGIALVLIFVWDRIEAEGEHQERMEQLEIAKEQATATRLMVESMNREERDRTKIRLFARVWREPRSMISLTVSNLSEFDLWLHEVEVIATEIEGTQPGKLTLGDGVRLAGGETNSHWGLQGALMTLNGNRADSMNAKFYVSVVASGLTEESVTVNSPEYHLTWRNGQPATLTAIGS